MRVLLDECLPRRLKRELSGLDVKTVPEMGWAGIKNGALVAAATGFIDVFVTADRNLTFQQNVPQFTFAVIVLRCKSNRFEDLLPLIPELVRTLPLSKPGTINIVG
jgi:hypothetical protein